MENKSQSFIMCGRFKKIEIIFMHVCVVCNVGDDWKFIMVISFID